MNKGIEREKTKPMYYYDIEQSGRRLKELRNRKGKEYTQEKVAEDVGISREFLNRLETGRKGCSVELLAILAQYYDVTVDYIICGKKVFNELSEKMDKLTSERRGLAVKIIDGILDNLL